jgi:hypothetical protein
MDWENAETMSFPAVAVPVALVIVAKPCVTAPLTIK